MSIKVTLTALAVALAVSGIAVVVYQRRVVHRGRNSRLVGLTSWLLTCGLMLAALGLVGFTFFPRGARDQPTSDSGSTSSGVQRNPIDPDARDGKAVLGTWTDNYRGKRTMTLNENGTGTMLVELTGLSATLYARQLRFDMVWSIEDRRLKKQTIGGDPPDKVALILKLMGDRVDEPILELSGDRLILLDKDGTTQYTWTRVR
jgi:hypothetical protein